MDLNTRSRENGFFIGISGLNPRKTSEAKAELFPTGYLRGACKLAGITYKDRTVNFFGEEGARPELRADPEKEIKDEKTYRVDVNGFLIDPKEWDVNFADTRARELMIKEGLTEKHMQIIMYMRESSRKKGEVPTIYETCEAIRSTWRNLSGFSQQDIIGEQ